MFMGLFFSATKPTFLVFAKISKKENIILHFSFHIQQKSKKNMFERKKNACPKNKTKQKNMSRKKKLIN